MQYLHFWYISSMEFTSCLKRQNELMDLFSACPSQEMRYQKIIEMGQKLPSFDATARLPCNLISGCQSIMYLKTLYENGKIYFNADSEALISKGLAALLIHVYSGEEPTAIAECPPSFIAKIGLNSALSPSRSNGLTSLYHRMRQEALKFLMIQTTNDGRGRYHAK